MKKSLAVAALAAALPFGAQAQSTPGFYIGAEGGLNWMFNSSFNTNVGIPALLGNATIGAPTNASFNTKKTTNSVVGYDFNNPQNKHKNQNHQNNNTKTTTNKNKQDHNNNGNGN